MHETSFEGYQIMTWWHGGLNNYLKYPADYYCGGQDNGEWGKLFVISMHGEDAVKKGPQNLQGFTGQFCTKTAGWYYLNRLERKYIVVDKGSKLVQFSNNVTTALSNGNFTLK